MSDKDWKPGQFPDCDPDDKVTVTLSSLDTRIGRAGEYNWCSDSNIVSWKPAPPKLETDAKVYVRDSVHMEWIAGHFKNWDEEKCVCWSAGRTSYTGRTTSSWKQWKLPEKDDV